MKHLGLSTAGYGMLFKSIVWYGLVISCHGCCVAGSHLVS